MTQSILSPTGENPQAASVKISQHILVSAAVSSNVEGFQEAVCYLEQDPETVVEKLLERLYVIQEKASNMMREEYADILEQVNVKVQSAHEGPKHLRRELDRLQSELIGYLDVLPIFTFNGSSYDYVLMSRYLFKLLDMTSDEKAFTVKRNNAYLCICTSRLRFLDIMLFLSPGTSYDAFLLTYSSRTSQGGAERKSHFPYEHVTSFEVLNGPFPEYKDFHSTLKNCNTLEASYLQYQAYLSEGLSEEQALNRMSLQNPPPTGQDEYEALRKDFFARGFTKLSDLLIAYNIQDVQPMIGAITNLYEFYLSLGVSILKQSITVAGVSRALIYRTAKESNVGFSLFHPKDASLHKLLSQGIIGGASLIFHRHQERDVTYLRGNSGPKTKSVVTWDANSLYLGAMGFDQPVGCYLHRRAENDFKPQRRQRYVISFMWLDFLAYKKKIFIAHALNQGREVTTNSGLKVDGFHHVTQTVFQFDGCYFHGCACVKIDPQDKKKMKQFQLRKESTQRRNALLQEGGYNLVIMKECRFRDMIKQNFELREFVHRWDPTFDNRGKPLEHDDVLKAIREGKMFGFVSASVYLPKATAGPLSAQEMYSIFPPVFTNKFVNFADIGRFSQRETVRSQVIEKIRLVIKRYFQQCKLDATPPNEAEFLKLIGKISFVAPPGQRLLVSLMNCDQIVISTDLLCWYLEHNFSVKIHEVIEYRKSKCLKPFVKMVSKARQEAPPDSIQNKTMKVLGNSAFGSVLLNRQKHNEVIYCNEATLLKRLNDPRFRKMQELSEGLYEVVMAPKSIRMDIPIQIGIQILGVAKRIMLSFVYDFLDVLVARCHLRILATDTDSVICSLAATTIDDVIKEESKEWYHKQLYGCHDIATEQISHLTNVGYFGRKCCVAHERADSKFPLYFKVENTAHAFCGLNAKTYCLRGEDKKVKFSCKGLQRNKMTRAWERYTAVLKTGIKDGVENISFRAFQGRVFSFKQKRLGLSKKYWKMRVLDDSISTEPLQLT